MHGIDSYPSRNSVFSKELMNHPSLSFLLSVENDDRLCSAADCLHEFTQCIKACEHNGLKYGIVGHVWKASGRLVFICLYDIFFQDISLHVLHAFCINEGVQSTETVKFWFLASIS